MTLRETLAKLTADYQSKLAAAFADASPAEVMALTQRVAGAAKPAAAGKGVTIDAIRTHLAQHAEGLHATALVKHFGAPKQKVTAVLKRGKEAGALKTTGQKRGTLYFVTDVYDPTAVATKKPRKAKSTGKGKGKKAKAAVAAG